MKKIIKFLFSRMFIVGILLLVQAITLGLGIWKLSEYFVYVYGTFTFISIGAVLYIVNTTDNPSYKLAWVIPILLVPVFGGLFYLLFGGKKMNKQFKREIGAIYEATIKYSEQDPNIILEIEKQSKSIASQAKYITNYSSYPIYKSTSTQYLSPGEVFFEKLKEELREAKHFIFMEYFIVEEGAMWNSILEIMAEKAKEGLDVRMMYDDAGTIQTLPYKYNEKLKSLGIKTVVFNEIKPTLNMRVNNRDHRKITVIDGHTGFTGGINLADEYINEIERFGHWKDASIMLKGEAVWNLTLMFLQVWDFSLGIVEDYEKYRPYTYHPEAFESDGYVQPYGDSPLDGEIVGENVYLNMINKAKDYIYITTPYLIVDNEMVTALTLAAKSGVDVRIITPHKEDKWYVHIVTRAYYPQLIEAGIKIYEYTPGFIHSKTFVCDDEVGVVGTINLDYRSLYLHFECGVWMYKTKSIFEMKEDYLKTLEVCTEITLKESYKVRLDKRLIRSILRLFAPLM